MRYLKKMSMPKSWPLHRKKGNRTYISKPEALVENSLTSLVILRDILKLAKTRAEIKKIVQEGQVEINGKKINDEAYPVQLFDVINLPKINKHYRLTLTKNGKLNVKEISIAESKKKACKIISKKVLKGNKIQINLDDGKNFITNDGEVNDSAIIELKTNKIENILKVKEKMNVMIINGKRKGHIGIITKIDGTGKKRIIHIKTNEKEIKSSIKDIIVLE